MSSDQPDLTAFDVDAAPEGACVHYERCGNVVPGRGTMCADCLEEVRARDREQRDGETR